LRFTLQQDQIAADEINIWYKSALCLLGRKRTMQEKFLLVKCDSWHLFFYHRIRSLFSQAEVSLLTRRPDEVYRSQVKSPGMHAVHGMLEPQLFQLNGAELAQMHPYIYLTHVLTFYQRGFAAIKTQDAAVLLQDYADGMDALIRDVANRINIPQDESWWNEINTRFQFHSKRPNDKFENEQASSERIPDFMQAHLEATMQAYWQLIKEHRKA
ncbi:MAG: hypothetical protein ACRCYO_11920, partial [Bacteroidia bacterium]